MLAGNRPKLSVHASRRRALWRIVRRDRAAAMLISKPQDVRYLSGFTGEDSFLLLAGGSASLLTDGRYQEQAARDCPDLEVHVRTGAVCPLLAGLLKKLKARSLAVQAEHMTVAFQSQLAKAVAPRRVRPLTDPVARLRATKDPGEVRQIRRAIRVAETAFKSLLAGGAKRLIGRSEREIAAELDYRMRLAGAERPAFETIVAAGSHSSLPHYRPGATRIRRDSALLIDWGATVGGYCSDLTRTAFLGRIPPKLMEIYPIVLRAQAAGIAAARPGVAAKTVDGAARDVIEQAGYGEQFLHSLGHGVGLETHEGPGLGRGGKARLRAGMVITVEPGIYLPKVGGVRIEDDVWIAPDGARRLSSLPRTLRAMVLR